jgi:hypothetical protein
MNASNDHQIKLRFSTSLLKPENYVLELSGISPEGSTQLLTTYPFRIVTK